MSSLAPPLDRDGVAQEGNALSLRSSSKHINRRSRTGRPVYISTSALRDKQHIMGEAGSGKSRFMGRVLGPCLLLSRRAQVILDPTGSTIENFLDKMMRECIRVRLPRQAQEALWRQILYVDMSGSEGYVTPFPLYYRYGHRDTFFDISQRFLDVVRRMDVHLANAPILGLNALATISTYAGMVLTALGCQITEAESLIRHPEAWQGQLDRALSLTPEVRPAVEFFRDFRNWKTSEQVNQSKTFLVKIMPFLADPYMQAIFGASSQGLEWEQVVAKNATVLLDFSRELNPERRRFKLLWCFRSLIDYAKLRGTAGRAKPFGFIIDELTQLLGFGNAAENSIMAEDIEELISVVSRNYGIFPLCIAHQNLPQLGSERIQKAVMTMGTQMIGVQSDPESALILSEYFYRYDPYQVKRHEPVWMSNLWGPFIVDYRPIEFTHEEQTILNSHHFRDLGRFEFIVRPALGEGDKRGKPRKVSIARLDPGVYPQPRIIDRIRTRLMKRDSQAVSDVLGEIQTRKQRIRQSLTPKPFVEGSAPEIELLEVGTPDT